MLHKPEKPHHKCAVTCARRAKHTSTSTPTINYPWFYDLSCSRASNRLLCFISALPGNLWYRESRNEKARDGDLSDFERFVCNLKYCSCSPSDSLTGELWFDINQKLHKFLFPFSTFRTHRLWHITSLCSFSHFSEPRSDRLALNGLSFLSLYICWPLVSRLKRSKMMYASKNCLDNHFSLLESSRSTAIHWCLIYWFDYVAGRCGGAQKVDFKRGYWRYYGCTGLPVPHLAQHVGCGPERRFAATEHIARLHRQHHRDQHPQQQ